MRTPASKFKILIFGAAAVIILGVTMVLVWIFVLNKAKTFKGAVVTNGRGCSDIGKSIFEKGGSAADAAIAALFCEGVSLPQSMGLGGGFLLTIYEKGTGTVKVLNARETAPSAANSTMFGGNHKLSQTGGLAVAVPGELKGYWYLHKEYGFLPWKDLIQPTIDMCKKGIYVTNFMADKLSSKRNALYADPVLREIFIDPKTNSTYEEGQYVKRPRLAKTLEIIAEEGADALYSHNGSLTEAFVEDIKRNGGIIEIDDMVNYEPEWQDPIVAQLSDGHTLYSTPLPGSGAVLAFILNILDGFVDKSRLYSVKSVQRIVEAFKFAYGYRTRLGDNNTESLEIQQKMTSKSFAEDIRSFIRDDWTSQNASYYGAETIGVEDHGTAQISVLAPNGDAISVTSTINAVFGAAFASNSTGIILNDEMDDFSSPNITNSFNVPPSRNNFIEPGKRPLSSMVPSIILKGKDVVLITGAAGGTKITTVTASIIMKHLWADVHLVESMREKRLHHQLFPMAIEYEEGFDLVYPGVVNNLTRIGHKAKYIPTTDGFVAMTSISTKGGEVLGAFDDRRGGYASYIED